jgi:recombination protein RecA
MSQEGKKVERDKALEMAVSQIERQFGKGAIMKLGEGAQRRVDVIPTGALALDLALGIGGVPRGRIVELYGPESSGKCLTADTYLWTDQGLETVAELFERCGQTASCTSRVTDIADLGVRAVNERGGLETISALTHNNRRPVLRVKLRSGRSVTGTYNHPLRVLNERGAIVWRKVGDIKSGDVVVSALFGADVATGSQSDLSEDEAVLIGYLVAEGSLSNRRAVCFTNWDSEVSGEFRGLVRGLFDREMVTYGEGDHFVHSKELRIELAERYGLDYVTAAGKSVPHVIRTAGPKLQRAFLSALFEGDGWIDGNSSIGLASASRHLAEEVQLLLYGLGVPSSLYSKHIEGYEQEYWTVTINPAATHRFLAEVGFRSQRRRDQVAKAFRRSPREPQVENIPGIRTLILDLRDSVGGDREFDRLAGDLFRSSMDLACSRLRLRRIVEWAEERVEEMSPSGHASLAYLKELAAGSYTFEQVVAVEDAGVQPTFDLHMPRTHSFLANGVLSHNTSLALHIVAEAQRNGGIAAFVDAEHALDPVYARAIGVDVDELLISQPDTGEQALEISDMLIRSGALDVIVIDSVAALVPRAEIEGEMGDSHVGLQARLMSQALRKLAGTLSKSRTTAVFINQLREKIGVQYGSPEITPGGRALKFYSSVRLDIRRIESIKDGSEDVGNRVRVKVAKNKMAPPFRKAEFDIMFGHGISREGSLLDVAVDNDVVKKSGAWFTFDEDQLGQGRENAKRFLRENPEVAVQLQAKVFEAVGMVPSDEEDEIEDGAETEASEESATAEE